MNLGSDRYIQGLLSDKHLIIADQSSRGTRDEKCIKLAELCSQAVDYPKNVSYCFNDTSRAKTNTKGIPVSLDDSPRLLMRNRPDW